MISPTNSDSRPAQEIRIGRYVLGPNHPAFIIAEIGVNHNGDPQLARRLVLEAKNAGADAVKFQTFRTDELVTAYSQKAEYQLRSTGAAESQRDMLRKLELSEREQEGLFEFCAANDILFLSTPFDRFSAEFLNRLGVPAFKVGSSDTDNLPLLAAIAAFGKPIILSSGMSDIAELREALEVVCPVNPDIVVLQCTSLYPCPPEESHLRAISTLREDLSCLTGFSDHTVGAGAALVAAVLGACVIEKHFTLDKNLPGPDHLASATPEEFRELVSALRLSERLSAAERLLQVTRIPGYDQFLGSPEKRISPGVTEAKMIEAAKKSIVASTDIPRGTVLTEAHLAVKRPGTGISPRNFLQIVGRTVRTDLKRDQPLDWNHFATP